MDWEQKKDDEGVEKKHKEAKREGGSKGEVLVEKTKNIRMSNRRRKKETTD